MQEIQLQSRIIEGIFFSPENGQLQIRFHNGETRAFTGVPESEVVAMCEAQSPGRHYIDRIRGHFRRIAA